MWAYVSYAASHWELIIVCLIGIAALSYLAFILKNWKVALAAAVIACCALAYQHADIAGYNRRVAEDVAAQTQIYKDRIEALNSIALKHAMETKHDDETIAKLREQSEQTPANDRACLDRDAASRVRSIR